MSHDSADKSGCLETIFDIVIETGGLAFLGKSEITMVLYLWRHGFIGTEGISAKQRFVAGDALGLQRSATYEVFRTLMQVGLLHRSESNDGTVRYGLNTCWRPSWPGARS